MAERTIPRIVIAGISSGAGKTTAAVGIIVDLRARGLKVAPFKCGPDYLDPTFHARAAGTPSHNLDGWMMGREAVLATFQRGSEHADIAIVEGVMGVFDGASPTGEEGSTAEIAKWLSAPVLLALDASGMARTVAAIAKGISAFDPGLNVAGLICNRVGSTGHLDLLRKATHPLPILGGYPKKPDLAFPERHLGLQTASQNTIPDTLLSSWGALTAEWFDLEALLRIARSAPALSSTATSATPKPECCRIGIAMDDAFHFYYEDNLRRLEALGAKLVFFSPINDKQLPDVDGIYIGGGYPEVHAAALSQNQSMLESLRRFADAGGPVYAECGGLMYLADAVQTLDGITHPMARLIPLTAVMAPKLQALGYAEVETQEPTILGNAGLRFRGHQFRYSELKDSQPSGPRYDCVYSVRKRRAGEVQHEGYRYKNVLASYVHAHWASNPLVALGFVKTCAARSGVRA